MSPARVIASAALSIAAFLAADAYTACLLSLPGSPAENLTEALRHLPSFLLGHGPLSLEDRCRARDGARGRKRSSGAHGRGRSPTGARSGRERSTGAPDGAPRAREGAS